MLKMSEKTYHFKLNCMLNNNSTNMINLFTELLKKRFFSKKNETVQYEKTLFQNTRHGEGSEILHSKTKLIIFRESLAKWKLCRPIVLKPRSIDSEVSNFTETPVKFSSIFPSRCWDFMLIFIKNTFWKETVEDYGVQNRVG